MLFLRKDVGVRTLAPVAATAVIALALSGCLASESDDPVDQSPVAVEETDLNEAPQNEPDDGPDPESDPESEPAQPDASGGIDAFVGDERASLGDPTQLFGGIYSDITVTARGESSVDYSYTYVDEMPVDEAQSYFEDSVQELEDATRTEVFPVMEAYGVPAPREVAFIYLNPDGSVIWEITITE